MISKWYSIPLIILAVTWSACTIIADRSSYIKQKIIFAIEYAYECKSDGKSLHQCEHEIKDKIQ